MDGKGYEPKLILTTEVLIALDELYFSSPQPHKYQIFAKICYKLGESL